MTVSEAADPGRFTRRRFATTSPVNGEKRASAGARVCLVLAIGLAATHGLVVGRAQAAPTDVAATVSRQDTLVVSGRSIADSPLPAVAGVVTVVDLETDRGGGDLAELLSRVAGLQIRRYGGIGAEAIPSIRGSTGAQVAVLVDGLPLADAQRGAVDLQLLPLERYDRAEVHRGLVPAAFGGIGAAGAINLHTRADAAGLDARVFAGSFGDLGGRASLGLEGGDGSRRAMLLVHGRRIDNDYTYVDHNQTIYATDDDTVRTRENADFEQWGVFGQGELEGGAGLARASVGYFRRDGGRPGPIGFPSPSARIRHERVDGRIGLRSSGGAVTFDLSAVRREDQLHDPAREVGADPYDQTVAVSEDLLGRLAWLPRWSLGESLALDITAGGDGRNQWYRQTNDGEDDPLRQRTTVTAFAGADLAWLGPRLSLRPGWRWQRIHDDFPPVPPLPWLPEEENVSHEQDAVSPSLGLGWQPVADRVTVQAHWYETVRQPSWIELFGQPGGLAGNRELVPEEVRGRDLGVLWTPHGDGALRVTAFAQDTDRTIIYYWAGLGISRPANIGRSTNRGLEVEGYLQQGPVDLAANFTYQEPRDAGGLDPTYEGKRLPYLSDRKAYGELGWRLGAWRPSVAVFYQSDNYRTRYNRDVDRMPERTLVNVALNWTWTRGDHATVVTAEVLNLTDSSIYDVEGYPVPGRSFRLSCHWR